MERRMALCVDEMSIRNPGLIGLEGELLTMKLFRCNPFRIHQRVAPLSWSSRP